MTLKQKLFVKKYIQNNGNGTQAVLETYDTTNPNVAGAISSENLRKPSIQKEIRQALEMKGLTPEVVVEALKTNLVAGVGVKATAETTNRAIDIYSKLTGLYDRQDIEQSYKVTLSKLNSKELTMELERLNKLSSSLIADLNS